MSVETEEVTDVDIDMDQDPMCEGLSFVLPLSGRLWHDECTEKATWLRTATCCITRTRLECDAHYLMDSSYEFGACSVCGGLVDNATWRRL